jgi:hypothetical protein
LRLQLHLIELNTTVNNVFAGENVLVEVTGSSTTWGQGNSWTVFLESNYWSEVE